MALAASLHAALGVMGTFLGPYGRVWEVGARLKGGATDEKTVVRRAQSRLLWRALLQGDFAYGKRLSDDELGARLVHEAPSEAVLLALLLLIGGYSGAAQRLTVPLGRKRRGVVGISSREATLLASLRDALDGDDAALVGIYQVASENASPPLLRQVASVTLFYAYKARKDLDRARAAANAIWAQSEAARHELEAMGVRPLVRDAAIPRPGKVTRESSPTREKAAASR
jgi:hypothetical protein